MVDSRSAPVEIVRKFNHDLLLDPPDQEAASQRWPALASILINPPLIRAFAKHEAKANTFKPIVQILGALAVVTMLAALLAYGAESWIAEGESGELSVFAEVSALASLTLAFLASRYGPLRRRWLKHRFITEVLRQWHFRRFLDGSTFSRSAAREADLSKLLADLAGSVGAKMDQLVEFRRDPLGRLAATRLPEEPRVRAQLLDAYRTLRIDHQRDFAMYKLSPDDRTFGPLSLVALTTVADRLAGSTLVLALFCSVARLATEFRWAPVAGVSLAMIGVAVRTWRDGLCLETEYERYQELIHELELLTARWEYADSDEQRLRVGEELERGAAEELRSFIRSHERAQFLF